MKNDFAKPVGELLASAHLRVIIISAFIRSHTLSFLLSKIQKGVDIRIYARWRIADIASGASDYEVISVAKNFNADFRVHDTLHAKIYVADDKALVGSANVTDRGLGRHPNSNLEVLVSTAAHNVRIQNVVNVLEKDSVEPPLFSDEVLQSMKQHFVYNSEQTADTDSIDSWLPSASPASVLATKWQEGNVASEVMKDCLALGVGAEISEKRVGEIVNTRRVFLELKGALDKHYSNALHHNDVVLLLSSAFSIDKQTATEKWVILTGWINMFADDMYTHSADNSEFELCLGNVISLGGNVQ